MAVRFITDQPAAFIPEIKTLVIAEMHLGLEYELYKSGVFIPAQAPQFEKTIYKLIRLTKAKTLVIVGDVKHKVPGSTIREDREIPRMLATLSRKIKTILVKGNHDDRIEEIVPEGVKIYSSRGFRIGKYGFFHGHAWPSKQLFACDYLFMGHIHPTVQFKDKFGYRIIEPVWVKSRIYQDKIKKRYKIKKTGKLEVIIMPPFNRLLGGVPVNVKEGDKLLGPLLKNDFIDMNNAELYFLDGSHLGKISALN